MQQPDFILYGAYGYTGRLIARMAAEYGLVPLLAGRREQPLREMAAETGYDWQTADLDRGGSVDALLGRAGVVLHAAGPFVHTARPMMEACIRNGVHYLDITGEIPVFEMAHSYHEKARQAGIMLMSGVGFDVVPTDCMALYLKQQLPNATHLRLAFSALGGGLSRGTATTMAENLGSPGAVRRDGRIVPVPVGYRTRRVPFLPGKERFAMTIPWGDVSTAWYTTGIPNIETYMGIAPSAYKWFRMQRYFGWLLRMDWVRNLARKRVQKGPAGPDDEQRARSRSLVWGEVENAAGEKRAARLQGPDGYTLTAISSLLILKKVKEGKTVVGFQTPAGAFGADLVLEVPHTHREDII